MSIDQLNAADVQIFDRFYFKRVAKAGEAAKPKQAAAGKAGTGTAKGSDEPLFQETVRETGLNRCLVEMTYIRDQCSWVHADEKEAATGLFLLTRAGRRR